MGGAESNPSNLQSIVAFQKEKKKTLLTLLYSVNHSLCTFENRLVNIIFSQGQSMIRNSSLRKQYTKITGSFCSQFNPNFRASDFNLLRNEPLGGCAIWLRYSCR